MNSRKGVCSTSATAMDIHRDVMSNANSYVIPSLSIVQGAHRGLTMWSGNHHPLLEPELRVALAVHIFRTEHRK